MSRCNFGGYAFLYIVNDFSYCTATFSLKNSAELLQVFIFIILA